MSTVPLRFTDELLARPAARGIDVVTTLANFAIVTYAIPPERLRPLVDERFELDCVDAQGQPKALVSVVPFEDLDFRFAACPWPKLRFGQTNYRAYVIDRATGRRLVWFFGTSLDSISVAVPRYWWKLPWYRGKIRFDCIWDVAANRYSRYRMTTKSEWAPAELELADDGQPVTSLDGYQDLEAALVTLTHPLIGAFHRRDGRLGTYSIWHDRLKMTTGHCLLARVGLFDRLGLVPYAEQSVPHSVLIQRETEFQIRLPPRLWDA